MFSTKLLTKKGLVNKSVELSSLAKRVDNLDH